jgi:propionate CoA-transferase
MHPLMVEVPGAVVDYVVVHDSGRQWEYGPMQGDMPATTGAHRMPLPELDGVDQCAGKVIGRRALQEVRRGDLVNAGGGVPITYMFPVAEEEGVAGQFRWSVEHGVFGGRTLSATHWNPTAITSPGWLLDFYNGGGLDQSFLAAGEIDRHGNVNVGRLGDQLPGPGGFTDIAASAPKVTFCGTLTGGGLHVDATSGELRILREGAVTKFVDACQMVCFSGRQALRQGQEVRYVTERAVFGLVDLGGGEPGLELLEVAPGIDLQSQVLDRAEFPVRVAAAVRTMDRRLFRPERVGIELAAR